ncbi:hydrolase [Pseudoalteromonas citrea]|uniref:Hydrolase n=2 Tax=Pseudoalteromonas citrea TaxID=43655 RepID=A0A5S3XN64_9GAMM|nr:serine hydrolase [Pseudoalteromonas citrea]TMP47156.1 hydrolase [Pseudoalteromonas citrea]TMP58087.1 hydrolase [Pseudoalteromonas citrea]
MHKKLKLKSAVMFMLFMSTCGRVDASNMNTSIESQHTAPKATEVEAKGRFWDLPYLEKAFITPKPEENEDGITVGKLDLNNTGKAGIIDFATAIAENKYGQYDSLLISHKGKLVFESYYHRGRVDLPHDQASAAKAYTSLLLGRAMQLGYLSMADLHKPLVHFLKGLDTEQLVKGAENITLHKVLTMRSGLKIHQEKADELSKRHSQLSSTVVNRVHGQGFVQELLVHSKPITPASQSFVYGNYNPTLVMQVIAAVVPGNVDKFIENELLDKLGITDYRWMTAISGLPEAGWRVSLKSRDMMKLAELVRNDGNWQGEQLIPVVYLDKATQKLTKPVSDWIPKHYSYGYFWYQTDVDINDKSYSTHIAWGGGGQRLIIVKELDLTIVTTGHDADDRIFEHIAKSVIPAFVL